MGFAYPENLSIFDKLVILCLVFILYGVLLIVYRLTLHPLASFPGRKLAIATKWYEFYYDIIHGFGGQYAWEIDRMHDQFGPIVRINPDELHVRDPDYYNTVYAPAPARRDKYGPGAKMVGCPLGTFGTIKHDVYRKRRAANSVFFSKRAISQAEALINEEAELLCQNLEQQYYNKSIKDVHTVFLAFTTDAVCRFIFGKSLGYQQAPQKAEDWRKTMAALPQITPLIKQFPWIVGVAMKISTRVLSRVVPHLARLLDLHQRMHREAAEYLRDKPTGLCVDSDSKSLDLPPTIFHAIDASALPTEEKSLPRLAEEGFVLIAAGTDTTSRALTYALYHLLANGDLMDRTRKEISTLMPYRTSKPKLKALQDLPFFTAVIKESLRIMELITSRLPLVSPSKLQYAEWVIPEKTPISLTINNVLLDPSIFPEPYKFQPNRWLQGGKLHDYLNAYFVPFGRGPRMCQGKDFAWAELYIGMAAVLRKFDLALYDVIKERDVDIVRDCFFGEPHPQSPGIRFQVVGLRS